MQITRVRFRLAARWSRKENALEANIEPRRGNGDMGWLFWKVFPQETMDEFKARGFDVTTLRFHIDKTQEAIAEHERRAGRAV